MLTPKEYIDKYKGKPTTKGPDEIWVHATDLMEHILKFKGDTIYPSHGNHGSNKKRFVESIDKGKDDFESCQEAFDTTYQSMEKLKPAYSEGIGDLSVDRYVNGHKKPFDTFEPIEVEVKQATTIFINMWVSAGERHCHDVKEAHDQCYKLAAMAESTGYPLRVVGCIPARWPQFNNGNKNLNIFIILKDYADPIFPAIWCGLRDNDVCNAFINVVGLHFTGCGSGIYYSSFRSINVVDVCEPDEEIITFGRYLEGGKDV